MNSNDHELAQDEEPLVLTLQQQDQHQQGRQQGQGDGSMNQVWLSKLDTMLATGRPQSSSFRRNIISNKATSDAADGGLRTMTPVANLSADEEQHQRQQQQRHRPQSSGVSFLPEGTTPQTNDTTTAAQTPKTRINDEEQTTIVKSVQQLTRKDLFGEPWKEGTGEVQNKGRLSRRTVSSATAIPRPPPPALSALASQTMFGSTFGSLNDGSAQLVDAVADVAEEAFSPSPRFLATATTTTSTSTAISSPPALTRLSSMRRRNMSATELDEERQSQQRMLDAQEVIKGVAPSDIPMGYWATNENLAATAPAADTTNNTNTMSLDRRARSANRLSVASIAAHASSQQQQQQPTTAADGAAGAVTRRSSTLLLSRRSSMRSVGGVTTNTCGSNDTGGATGPCLTLSEKEQRRRHKQRQQRQQERYNLVAKSFADPSIVFADMRNQHTRFAARANKLCTTFPTYHDVLTHVTSNLSDWASEGIQASSDAFAQEAAEIISRHTHETRREFHAKEKLVDQRINKSIETIKRVKEWKKNLKRALDERLVSYREKAKHVDKKVATESTEVESIYHLINTLYEKQASLSLEIGLIGNVEEKIDSVLAANQKLADDKSALFAKLRRIRIDLQPSIYQVHEATSHVHFSGYRIVAKRNTLQRRLNEQSKVKQGLEADLKALYEKLDDLDGELGFWQESYEERREEVLRGWTPRPGDDGDDARTGTANQRNSINTGGVTETTTASGAVGADTSTNNPLSLSLLLNRSSSLGRSSSGSKDHSFTEVPLLAKSSSATKLPSPSQPEEQQQQTQSLRQSTASLVTAEYNKLLLTQQQIRRTQEEYKKALRVLIPIAAPVVAMLHNVPQHATGTASAAAAVAAAVTSVTSGTTAAAGGGGVSTVAALQQQQQQHLQQHFVIPAREDASIAAVPTSSDVRKYIAPFLQTPFDVSNLRWSICQTERHAFDFLKQVSLQYTTIYASGGVSKEPHGSSPTAPAATTTTATTEPSPTTTSASSSSPLPATSSSSSFVSSPPYPPALAAALPPCRAATPEQLFSDLITRSANVVFSQDPKGSILNLLKSCEIFEPFSPLCTAVLRLMNARLHPLWIDVAAVPSAQRLSASFQSLDAANTAHLSLKSCYAPLTKEYLAVSLFGYTELNQARFALLLDGAVKSQITVKYPQLFLDVASGGEEQNLASTTASTTLSATTTSATAATTTTTSATTRSVGLFYRTLISHHLKLRDFVLSQLRDEISNGVISSEVAPSLLLVSEAHVRHVVSSFVYDANTYGCAKGVKYPSSTVTEGRLCSVANAKQLLDALLPLPATSSSSSSSAPSFVMQRHAGSEHFPSYVDSFRGVGFADYQTAEEKEMQQAEAVEAQQQQQADEAASSRFRQRGTLPPTTQGRAGPRASLAFALGRKPTATTPAASSTAATGSGSTVQNASSAPVPPLSVTAVGPVSSTKWQRSCAGGAAGSSTVYCDFAASDFVNARIVLSWLAAANIKVQKRL